MDPDMNRKYSWINDFSISKGESNNEPTDNSPTLACFIALNNESVSYTHLTLPTICSV